jgi:hypothetical protein
MSRDEAAVEVLRQAWKLLPAIDDPARPEIVAAVAEVLAFAGLVMLEAHEKGAGVALARRLADRVQLVCTHRTDRTELH